MRSLRIDSGTQQIPKSRLRRSLIRIHKNRNHFIDDSHRADDLFFAWQQKWGNRREEIARQLEMIESQLAELGETDTSRPQLSLVGARE